MSFMLLLVEYGKIGRLIKGHDASKPKCSRQLQGRRQGEGRLSQDMSTTECLRQPQRLCLSSGTISLSSTYFNCCSIFGMMTSVGMERTERN